jgi:hypothetical protein
MDPPGWEHCDIEERQSNLISEKGNILRAPPLDIAQEPTILPYAVP